MKRSILVLFFGACALWGQGSPNCSQALTFIGATPGASINTISGAAAGCAGWRLTWSVTGFTAATIQLEGSQDNSSWAAFSGATIVLEGSNPTSWTSATASNTIVVRASLPYVRVNVTGVTGSGTIKTLILGYSGTSAQMDNGSGSGGAPAFSAITSGTNSAATMTVGTGATVTASGSGIVNANQINGGTMPASQGCIGTNGSSQPIAGTCGGGTTTGGGGFLGYSANVLAAVWTGTIYFPVSGGAQPSTTETTVQTVTPYAAKAVNLYIQVSVAFGVGNSVVFTLRDNAANTTVTCTISGASATSCSDVAHTATVAQGDLLTVQAVVTGSVAVSPNITITLSYGAVGSSTLTLSNAAVTGTTLNTLTKVSGAPSAAVIASTTDAGGIVGITSSGAGTSGSATISLSGSASCVFDGATTAGDYVTISNTVAGNCHDFGTSYPVFQQTIGRVLSTNAGGGTYVVDLFPSELNANGSVQQLPAFSWDNQGGSTATDTNGAELLSVGAPPTSGISWRYTLAPATPYSLTALLRPNWVGAWGGDCRYGLIFRKSSTGQLINLQFAKNGSDSPYVAIDYWTNGTTFSSDFYLNTSNGWFPVTNYASYVWMRITDDGTNLSFWFSLDGVFFRQVGTSVSRTAFIAGGPDQIGYFAGSSSSLHPAVALLQWAAR